MRFAMRCCLLGFALSLVAMSVGCDEEPPPLVLPPPPPPPPRAVVASPRAISGPGAFDLIITDEGPLLLFGPPSAAGGGVRALSLGAKGEAEGAERTLAGGAGAAELAPQSEEIVAAASGGRLRIAWVERDQLVFTTRTMMADGAAQAPGPIEDLGPTTRTRTGRGSLAMAAHEGSFDLFFRGDDGPCNTAQVAARAGRCARFSIHRAGGTPTARRGGGLSVPATCTRPVIGFVTSSSGVWYEAVCALEDGTPKTTVFALQFEPEYAHAEPVLPGCVPRSLTSVGDGVVLSAHCEGARTVWITNAGRDVRTYDEPPTFHCNNGRPVWSLGDRQLELSEPRDGLEGLMGTDVSEHARAAWTGESLLVAESVGDEVAVRRFECDGDSFRRTDHEAL